MIYLIIILAIAIPIFAIKLDNKKGEKMINTKKIYDTIMLEMMDNNTSEQTNCETWAAIYNLMAKLERCKTETNLNNEIEKRRKNAKENKITNNKNR